MTTGQVRWGFLGAGFVASLALAPAVRAAKNAQLQVVAARDLQRAQELEPNSCVTSYREVCEADDVDIIYLSLPNGDHLEWVVAALRAGKDVVCEKPLGLSAADVATMTAVAESTGRMLVEAAWNRWHPRTQRISELVGERTGAREVTAAFTFNGVPEGNYRLDPANGGGALYDVGCYAIAAALAVIGADVTVTEANASFGPTGVDLTTSAVLTSTLGSAHVLASFEQPESQVLRVAAPDFLLEVPHPAFTSWREESMLRVVAEGSDRSEAFPECDAYQLMVEAVSSRHGGDDAWVLPLSSSWETARVLDQIRERTAPASH
ncbi:MAG: Gfo/Idh/MocA family oxidoreductase [Actinomycetes bacterium]